MTNKLIDVFGYEDGMSPSGNPYNVPSSVANVLINAGRARLAASSAVAGTPEDGFSGFTGWTAVPSLTTDGGKLVMRLTWVGGTGTAPTAGFVGPTGLVTSAADAVDMLGQMVDDDQDSDTPSVPLVGKSGWSPMPAIEADGARQVMRITWVGGTGTPPTAGYVSADGLVATAAEAADIKGDPGTGGASTLPAMTTAAVAATAAQKTAHRDALGLGPIASMTLPEAQSAVSGGLIPWESRPDPVAAGVGATFRCANIPQGGGGVTFVSDGARWCIYQQTMIAGSAVATAPITGTTAETVMTSFTLPGGLLGPNGALEVQAQFSTNQSANIHISRIYLGPSILHVAAPVNTTYQGVRAIIANRNSQNAQISSPSNLFSPEAAGVNAINTATIDTSVNQTVSIRCGLVAAADSMTLESWSATFVARS